MTNNILAVEQNLWHCINDVASQGKNLRLTLKRDTDLLVFIEDKKAVRWELRVDGKVVSQGVGAPSGAFVAEHTIDGLFR